MMTAYLNQTIKQEPSMSQIQAMQPSLHVVTDVLHYADYMKDMKNPRTGLSTLMGFAISAIFFNIWFRT